MCGRYSLYVISFPHQKDSMIGMKSVMLSDRDLTIVKSITEQMLSSKKLSITNLRK